MLEQYKKYLAEFVAIPSVSTDDQNKSDMGRAVDWLKKLFETNSFSVKVIEGYGNPIVFAEYKVDPQKETCLIYGHYDVQPAHKEDGWTDDPFILSERNGRLYARGVVDNKGQVLIHILSIIELIKTNQLSYNIKFMLEGDEETGSGKLEDFIQSHQDLLKADFALLSDGEFGEFPTIEAGFRGGFNCTLTLKTSHTDLHSGVYGTAAPNAAHELADLLSTFYDEHHQIQFKGFYEDVDEISEDILQKNRDLPYSLEYHQKVSGTKALLTEPGYDFHTQVGLRPTVQVTGLHSGYTGDGYRNSIAGRATAKINFRLVNSQDPKKIAALFEAHVKEHIPEYCEFEINYSDFHYGVKLDLNNIFAERASEAVTNSHKQKPVYKFCGGGLPIVTHFDQILNIPTLSVSLGNDDCGMHAADENFNIEYINKGLEFSKEFFSK